MTRIIAFLTGAALLAGTASAAETDRTHFPAGGTPPAGMAMPAGATAPFSAAVLAGRTLYVSGTTDHDPATGKAAATAEAGARIVLEAVKKTVEAGGMTMNDLVWVQVFCTDLTYFQSFNAVYKTYFKGPLPARAFVGVDHLLGGAHYEMMGVAVQRAK